MFNAFQFFFHIIFWSFCLYLVGIANKVKIFFVGLLSFEYPRFRFLVLIEIFGVDIGLKLRNEWWLHISYLTPIYIIEPRVALDLISPVSAKTDALIREKTADQVHYFKGDGYFRWKVQVLLVILYLEINFIVVLTGEWRIADQHFIDDDSHCPPVHKLPIPRPPQHLRCDVIRRAHSAEGQFSALLSL